MLFFCKASCLLRRRILITTLAASALVLPALFLPGATWAHLLMLPGLAALWLLTAALMLPALRPGLIRDAEARQVFVEGRLLSPGREAGSVRLPFAADDATPLLKRPGALLLASAATCTLGCVGPDAPALADLLARYGFTPDRFLARCPILSETTLRGIPGVVTRDGQGRRAYFTAAPGPLLNACAAVWEGAERPVTDEDRHLAASLTVPGACAFAMAEVTAEGPDRLVYLGSLLVDAIPGDATDRLRQRGWQVLGTPTPQANDPVAFASACLTLTDAPLTDGLYFCEPVDDLAAAAEAAVRDLHAAEATLRAGLLGLVTVLLAGAVAQAAPLFAALGGILLCGSLLLCPAPRSPELPLPRALTAWLPPLAWTALAALGLSAFAGAVGMAPLAFALMPLGVALPLSLAPALVAGKPRVSWGILPAGVLTAALVACTLLQAAPLQGVFMALGGILTGTVALLLRNAATKFAGKCS